MTDALESQRLQDMMQSQINRLLDLKEKQMNNRKESKAVNDDEFFASKLLDELQWRLKHLKQNEELKQMQQKLSNLLLKPEDNSCKLENWFSQMCSYNSSWTGHFTDDRACYDIMFEDGSLSFGSRFQKVCLRLSIMKKETTNGTGTDFIVRSTIGLNNLQQNCISYLTEDKSALEFIEEVVWKGIKEIA